MLALVTEAYGGRGGIAQAARDVIDQLASMETVESVDVLPRLTTEVPKNVPFKVHQRPPCENRIAFAAKALAPAGATPSLVFCNHLYMAPLAVLAARRARAKCVVQLHGVEIWTEPTRAQRWALEQADLVLCVSRDTRKRLLTYCDISHHRAIVVNNTVNACFTPGDRDAARAKFGIAEEFALLIVGRLDSREQYKGHDRVIAALPHLKHPENRDVVFLIAGDGNDRVRLQAEAQSLGVSERVRFMGHIPATDLPDLYRASDLFVLPSTGEGFGIVFLEAMACGTPALGLAAGGSPDGLADGALATMVRDVETLTEALQEAIAAPRVDAAALSAAAISRFGPHAFRESIAVSINLLELQGCRTS